MLDGGIADSIPLQYFESIGYEHNVVILTQPRGFVKKKNELMPLMKMKYRKYPKLIEAMAGRHNVYNATTEYIRKQEQKGNAYVICPSEPLPIGHVEHHPENLQKIYEIGRTTALSQLDALRKFR